MNSRIKPTSKKIIDESGRQIWHISYTDEKGRVYEYQHHNLNIAIRSWYSMFTTTLGIKSGGG
jgi:hypothetical protein